MRDLTDPRIIAAKQAGELWEDIFRRHAEMTRDLPVTPAPKPTEPRSKRSWFEEIGAGQYDKPPEAATDGGTERPRKIRRNGELSFFGDRKPI